MSSKLLASRYLTQRIPLTYHPPKHILEVIQMIAFEEALEPDDPRFARARCSVR